MDYTKPLIVPAGSDALGQIGEYVGEVTWCVVCTLIFTAGAPSLSAGDLAKINAKSVLALSPHSNPSVCVCVCAETPWSYGSKLTVDSSHRYIYICHLSSFQIKPL